jgi:hypothetical protein
MTRLTAVRGCSLAPCSGGDVHLPDVEGYQQPNGSHRHPSHEAEHSRVRIAHERQRAELNGRAYCAPGTEGLHYLLGLTQTANPS